MKRQVKTQEDLFTKYHASETVSIQNILLPVFFKKKAKIFFS